MKPLLFESNETAFVSQGLGALTDCISCYVEEKINGTYELTMVYPTSGIHYDEIKEFRLIYVIHDDTGEKEPFEIYKISRPINGKVTINAWHISYRLRKLTCSPFEAANLPAALGAFQASCMSQNSPFTFTTTRTTAIGMKLETPMAMRSVLGGVAGSFLDVYGGKWRFRLFDCELKVRRGRDTDYSIVYGKNLVSAKHTSDMTNIWNGIVPFWSKEEGQTVYYHGIVYSDYASSFPEEMVIPMDCTDDFDDEPTQEQLQAWGES